VPAKFPNSGYKEFAAAYDVTRLTSKTEAGSDQNLFTKGNDLSAILPRWPGRRLG
jgi:hypothetical protein